MTVITKLACMQGRKDTEPNQILSGELVEKHDADGIREVVENLWNKDKRIQSDCASVLEEVGRLAPELIEDYVSDFLKLLSSKNNRLVWGSMILLAMVADRKPAELFNHRDDIIKAIERGSVITQDNGIKTLAIVASVNETYNEALFPFLIAHLQSCRPKSIPQHAESIARSVTPVNQEQFVEVLNQRIDALSSAQQRRINKLLKQFD